MTGKQKVLDAIGAIAKELGRTPSLLEFVRRSGISKYSVLRLFPKWNEAVREAKIEPCRLYVRPEDNELLTDWGETVRRKGAVPSRSAYLVTGRYYPRTIEKRFGGWPTVPQAFRKFAEGKREWTDVLALLSVAKRNERDAAREDRRCSNPPNYGRHAELRDRVTYGDPMDFRGLRHEPVNEQGVVLLFGMVARELGYLVEGMQRGFPDCEAKRRIGPERWQRVNIEFEFESRNFRQHGHSASGCDVIVCWRHNWDECPKKIEVVELSRVIKSLAQSKGGEQRGRGQALSYRKVPMSAGNLRGSLSKPVKTGTRSLTPLGLRKISPRV